MKKRRKLKKKFVIFLSIYAMFFVSYFTLTTLARYTSLLNKNGNISVAKWNITLDGEDDKKLPTMFIGDSSTYQTYELSVTSKSEIAINYSAIISNVPAGIKVQVDDDKIYNEVDNNISISNLGKFNANDINSTHNHKLKILVPLGTNPFNEQRLNIDVVFTQVDL